ncbi:lysoplasmalogenase [Pseudomonas sp. QL9]|uniref:lysoplasmalogenase n=1 Tax=Pseudomonas sp. QL9 TaxID=3242725 RepID=UPI00352B2F0F
MRWLLPLAVLGGLAHLLGMALDLPWLRMLSKPLPILALLLWVGAANPSAYRRWILLGLGLSLLGDILLEWPLNAFVPGLATFLLAHVAYLVAYLSETRRLAPLALVCAALPGIGLFLLLDSHGLGELRLPIVLYSLTISSMLWRALARLATPISPSAWLAASGALLFMLSDSMIGISRFLDAFDGSGYAIMLTYWLGQLGIAASVSFGRRALPYSLSESAT